MAKINRLKFFRKRNRNTVSWLTSPDAFDVLCCQGYTSLDKNPEIMTACSQIAKLIGSITIHLMSNTEKGDIRILNELSRQIDINPNRYMTRKVWMEAIVMNLLLYGRGNSVVLVHTEDGYLRDMEPIRASRVSFQADGYGYKVLIDGIPFTPDDVLHFVENPDETHPWMGKGYAVQLKDVANNLKQAAATKKGFLESRWKPSVIVKVDSTDDVFSRPESRKKLADEFLQVSSAGEPWMIPAEQLEVQQVKPLTLNDLAINDAVKIDKQTVAAILGVPAFLLGVGDYSKNAWNNFIQTTVKELVDGIQQEMTRKLILNPKWYIKFNYLSLMDWDLQSIYEVFGGLSDRGIVTGNEVRDRLGMSPLDGLDEPRLLENYIPADMIGKQKKLVQEE